MNAQRQLVNMREEIDLIDNALLKLLEARKQRVAAIAQRKQQHSIVALDPAREEQIIATMLQSSNGVFAREELETIFREIIDRCRPGLVAHR